ncbi:MAG: hypothetical protein ACRERC_25395 [Candidatus Binatia bacterium]
MVRVGAAAASLGLLMWLALASPAAAQDVCVGDCNSDGAVSIGELLVGVNISLGSAAVSSCPGFDSNASGSVQITELLGGVRSAVQGCRAVEPTATPMPTPTATPEDFVAAAADFECLTDWARVRRFRIANPLGYLDEALAVARGEAAPPYPVGTIIQLVPNEAMVKRAPGFYPEAHDWEFFVLSASGAGTDITQRGRGEVVNIGAPCFACHAAAPQTDFVCESANGCVALNLSEALITFLQENDPRCTAPLAAHP